MAEERTRLAGLGFIKRRALRNRQDGAKPGARFAILEEWKIVSLADAKGALRLCLEGIAFGDAHPLQGSVARTSALTRYRMDGRRLVVITRSGSEYMLGLRKASQDEDKQRLIRYLDRIANARNAWPAGSDSSIETDILGISDSETEQKAAAKR